MEKQKGTAVHSASYLNNLQEKMVERSAILFMGLKVKNLLTALDDLRKAGVFRNGVCAFYECCISYLQEWGETFPEVKVLSWTLLNSVPQWVECSLQYVTSKLRQSNIDEAQLFDETTSVKMYTTEKVAQWNTDGKPADERWAEMFAHFQTRGVPFKNIGLICQFAMCLPGTNAPVERIFFIMNNTWMDERNHMGLTTLKALLITRVNFYDSCAEFHESTRQTSILLNTSSQCNATS
ncbi:hypothetical protein SKAU_G00097580 [Synaphobranchus kaupii]|uniref:HAT C-terminal dimerisation domain-containing protein n=1 Tax=Synaphobranchus kaupii TaxID=118154 RepID=A0A9Q1FYU4_SYNKA|nr:hypothetical protein SKAU_G00097580 [Synaphobranchus kaupii]